MNKYYAYIKQHSNINRPLSSLHSLLPVYNQVFLLFQKHTLPAHKHTHFTCPQTYPFYLPTNIPTLPAQTYTLYLPTNMPTIFCPQTYPLYLLTNIPTLPVHKHTLPAHKHTDFTCPQRYPLYLPQTYPI